jgi:hypothetical protein
VKRERRSAINSQPSLSTRKEARSLPLDDEHLSSSFLFDMSSLPTELITEIVKLYFRIYTPSTPLDLPKIYLPHAASLRLIDSTFHDIIDESSLPLPLRHSRNS